MREKAERTVQLLLGECVEVSLDTTENSRIPENDTVSIEISRCLDKS